jgi:hypothetical protein
MKFSFPSNYHDGRPRDLVLRNLRPHIFDSYLEAQRRSLPYASRAADDCVARHVGKNSHDAIWMRGLDKYILYDEGDRECWFLLHANGLRACRTETRPLPKFKLVNHAPSRPSRRQPAFQTHADFTLLTSRLASEIDEAIKRSANDAGLDMERNQRANCQLADQPSSDPDGSILVPNLVHVRCRPPTGLPPSIRDDASISCTASRASTGGHADLR